MIQRKKDPWKKLTSGLYVPPYLKFAGGYPCCCGVPCQFCPTGTPESIEVTITSVGTGGVPACDECRDLEGVYVLTRVDELPDVGSIQDVELSCTWWYEFPEPIVCGQITHLRAWTRSASALRVDALPNDVFLNWSHTRDSTVGACNNWSGQDIPFEILGPPGCRQAGVIPVCTVTSL